MRTHTNTHTQTHTHTFIYIQLYCVLDHKINIDLMPERMKYQYLVYNKPYRHSRAWPLDRVRVKVSRQ